MKKGKPAKTTGEYSVDQMMTNVASSLVRDFQANLNDPCFCSGFLEKLRQGSIAGIREAAPAPNEEMDVAEFKATYQLESVLKRFRYQSDIYSDDELTKKAIQSFKDTQIRLACQDLDSLCETSQAILDYAAGYVARVLGTYDDEEHRSLCRFGSKASVGIPARAASEAARWEIPISGSREQISWFDSEMSQDQAVQNYWAAQKAVPGREGQATYQEVSSLTLTLVPKTFKSLRAIMPNTTIGSYQSYGLGEMMRTRLRREGFDIRRLQQRHRRLARTASVYNMHTTADLSSASDSISVRLVERLLPHDWFEILNANRIGMTALPDGTVVQSLTFCTMGIGYTFPLQTLIFLALLKAIEAILYHRSDRRLISVYGDDMIYASRMHPDVVKFFERFGFVINLDKTFHEGHFRESCGGDYYHGVDVRPFQPKNGSAMVRKQAYEAILYKFVNGLLARWSEYEIGRTLQFLVTEIESVTGKSKLVPGDYPDDSGIKCPTLTHWNFLVRTKCAQLKSLGHGVYRFSYLRFDVDLRKEDRHGPYLRAVLRGLAPPTIDHVGGLALERLHTPLGLKLLWPELYEEKTSTLITQVDKPIKMFRGNSGHRFRRTSTYVTISHTGRYTRQSGTACFADRR